MYKMKMRALRRTLCAVKEMNQRKKRYIKGEYFI